jgi:geranylgeranyl diphosphate/geranylgeranyl-bacteriochlorophyllide a reductase
VFKLKINDIERIPLGFDIIIIGAGSAGCVLAKNLSKEFKILIIDSKELPRTKACSGILVSESKDFFKEGLPDNIFFNPKKLDIEYIDFNNDSSKFIQKSFYNSSRKELDKFLFEQILTLPNVFILANTKLIEFYHSDESNKIIVVCENKGIVKPLIANNLVGCDGALSLVRRKIFAKQIPFYIGIQETFKIKKSIKHAYFIFDDELTDFYSWIIPKGNKVEIGALLNPEDVKKKYSLFKNKIKIKFGIEGNGNIDSAIVLRPHSVNDLCLGKQNVLLCGEAAGLISPSSAEGISFAIRSAKFCANALNKNSKNPLKVYLKEIKPLLLRLESKFKKSKNLASAKNRKKLFGE